MNAYLVMEAGESRVYAAADFNGAILAAWFDVMADEVEARGSQYTEDEARAARATWEQEELQSVTLVGAIENYDVLARARPVT